MTDRWIPSRCEHGTGLATLAEIISGASAPDIIRPDLNAAFHEFCIGIVQCTMTPSDEDEWLERYENPPSTQDLQAAFARLAPAFDMTVFLQDRITASVSDVRPVHDLLHDAPKPQTASLNRDLFTKRSPNNYALSIESAALILFAHQVWATVGGKGYRVSIRGGGPETFLVCDKTLWTTIWRNVLTADELDSYGWAMPEPDHFLWMRDGFEGRDPDYPPGSCHPCAIFFPNSRRVHLNIEPVADGDEFSCPVSGRASALKVSTYKVRNYGPCFSGLGWTHPLSASVLCLNDPALTHPKLAKMSRDHLAAYNALLVRDDAASWTKKDKVTKQEKFYVEQTADVIRHNRTSRALLLQDSGINIWRFGYAFDNAKMLSWTESRQEIAFCARPDEMDRETRRLLRGYQAAFSKLDEALTPVLRRSGLSQRSGTIVTEHQLVAAFENARKEIVAAMSEDDDEQRLVVLVRIREGFLRALRRWMAATVQAHKVNISLNWAAEEYAHAVTSLRKKVVNKAIADALSIAVPTFEQEFSA